MYCVYVNVCIVAVYLLHNITEQKCFMLCTCKHFFFFVFFFNYKKGKIEKDSYQHYRLIGSPICVYEADARAAVEHLSSLMTLIEN